MTLSIGMQLLKTTGELTFSSRLMPAVTLTKLRRTADRRAHVTTPTRPEDFTVSIYLTRDGSRCERRPG